MNLYRRLVTDGPLGRVRTAMATAPTSSAVALPGPAAVADDTTAGPGRADDGVAGQGEERKRLTLGRLLGRLWASVAAVWRSVADLDASRLIAVVIERPGAHLLWALKLGRFRFVDQLARRDSNTVAGVLMWIVLLCILAAAG